jgi:hypothetical protein
MGAAIYKYNNPQLTMQQFAAVIGITTMLQCTDYTASSILGPTAIRDWQPIYKQ